MPSFADIVKELAKPKRKGVQLKVKESIGWKRMMDELRQLAETGSISGGAGVFDSGPGAQVEHRGDLTNLQIAMIHEFGVILRSRAGVTVGEQMGTLTISGAVVIPERSFIRKSFDENYNKYDQLVIDVAKRVIDPSSKNPLRMDQACAMVARRMALDIKGRVEKGLVEPKLSEEWLKRKKSGDERPLLDTGKMLNAVVAVVQKMGSRQTEGLGSQGEQGETSFVGELKEMIGEAGELVEVAPELL